VPQSQGWGGRGNGREVRKGKDSKEGRPNQTKKSFHIAMVPLFCPGGRRRTRASGVTRRIDGRTGGESNPDSPLTSAGEARKPRRGKERAMGKRRELVWSDEVAVIGRKFL